MAFASRSNPYQPDATEPVAGPSNTASSYYAVHPTFNPSSAALASRPTVVPGSRGYQVDPAPPQHPLVHARRFGASKRGKAPERRQRTGASAGMVFEGYVLASQGSHLTLSVIPIAPISVIQPCLAIQLQILLVSSTWNA
jgi:hypothetical protein